MSTVTTVPPSTSYGTIDDPSLGLLSNEPQTWKAKLRRAREDGGGGTIDTGYIVLQLFFATVVYSIVVVLELFVGIAMIAIGTSRVYSCPVEPALPPLIITGGIIVFLSCFVHLGIHWSTPKPPPGPTPKNEGARIFVNFLFNTVSLGVFIAICFFVYPNVWPSLNPQSAFYCDPLLFKFAFYLVNAVWLYIICVTFILFFAVCCAICFLPIPSD